MEFKKFSTAILFWLLVGVLGGHRVYIHEQPVFFLFYWIGTVLTFGLLPLVDVFFIKGAVIQANHAAGYSQEPGMK